MTRAALAGLLATALAAGCAQAVTTGAFTQTHRIETELKRGVSSKMDVRRVLGAPKGTGGAMLPTDPHGGEVWYYEDIRVANVRRDGERYLRADVRQQILLVFFRDGRFDGFLWYAGGGTAEGR